MTHDEILTAALTQYPFRTRRATEHRDAYLAAVVDHLRSYDWGLSEEVRIGKRQADWTGAEVTAFEQRLLSKRQTSQEFSPGVHHIIGEEDPGPYPVTENYLLEMASIVLDALTEQRRQHPMAPLPIVARVLLTDGRVLTAFPAGDERIAILKAFARRAPVFGYVLVFDAFMHLITSGTSATKVDCLMQHIGTRELRLVKRRPYRLAGRRVVFDAAPPPDLDSRAPDSWQMEDPYAEIFVSVPPSHGAPS